MLQRNTRREMRDLTSRFKAGLLAPVMAVPFEPGDGGTVAQTVTFELDPVAGRIITPIFAEVISVFVPVTAIERLLNPTVETADIPEVVKLKYLTGNPLYLLEAETDISKRLGVVPQKIANVQQVCTISRLAYNAAVNMLRRRRYAYAVEILHTSTAIERAILSETVLDRFNAVLDPADQQNGRVALDIGTMNLPIPGITRPGGIVNAAALLNMAAGTATVGAAGQNLVFAIAQNGGLTATFNGSATGVSLVDFYKAENHDKMIRVFEKIVQDNPLDGEEAVMRFVHGFTMEPGRHPVVVAERKVAFGLDVRQAMDNAGIQADAMMSKGMTQISFTAVVPSSEIGGVLVTIASVKPDETIKDQPHPILSKPWAIVNTVDDETKLDPVPVLMREVDSEIATGSETTVGFYTGLNELKRSYVNYGFTRNTSPISVEDKTAIWQVKVPASVTPENVVYPVIDQYPFLDQNAEIVRCRIQSMAAIATRTVFGPTPIEEIDIVQTEGLLT
jgi:hypothetical protein